MKESDFAKKPNNRQDQGGKIAQISQTFSTFMEKNLCFFYFCSEPCIKANVSTPAIFPSPLLRHILALI